MFTVKVVICGKSKTWIKSQKFNVSPWNLEDFLFLLFSTVYNVKKRDMLFKKVF